jgi:murein DD-endopeptidase MepM/ murein hydrolase activator NlpD
MSTFGWAGRIRTSMVVTVSIAGTVASASVGEPASAVSPVSAVVASVVAPASVAVHYRLPVTGPARILIPFRPPAERWGAGHRGVDLVAGAGAGVRAAGSGVVAYAGRLADRGVISIRHSATLRTTYEPVRPLVAVGQHVQTGQPIGVVEPGHLPCAPADCLHWGARIGADHHIDPMALLNGWPIRLKPWAGPAG